jgi:flagellar motor switch protein FliN/FliY
MPDEPTNTEAQPAVSPEPQTDVTDAEEQPAATLPPKEAGPASDANIESSSPPTGEPANGAPTDSAEKGTWVPDETSSQPADQGAASATAAPAHDGPGTATFDQPDFSAERAATDLATIDMLDDVELDVKVELGRTEMLIEQVLGLGVGSVVELDKAAGDPVDIYVNERLVARGEVLVLNNSFCVRISDVLSPIPALEREA